MGITTKIDRPEGKQLELPNPVIGFEAYHWPETQALFKRLGINPALHRRVVIDLDIDGVVVIMMEQLGGDTGSTDSTSVQNKEYRTVLPKPEIVNARA